MIAGQPAGAIELLKQIPNTPDERIYVYQFFYSRDRDTIVDRTIDGGRLVEATIQYLDRHRNDPIGDQMDLVHEIGSLKMK